MDFITVIRGVRDVVTADVDGIRSAHYPAPNNLEAVDLPALVLYSGNPEERITINHRTTEQEWGGSMYGQLVTARLGDTPEEFASVDALLTPLVDAFRVDGDGNTAVERHPEMFGYGLYQLFVTGLWPSQRIGYGNQEYYGALVYWSFRLDRIPGGN